MLCFTGRRGWREGCHRGLEEELFLPLLSVSHLWLLLKSRTAQSLSCSRRKQDSLGKKRLPLQVFQTGFTIQGHAASALIVLNCLILMVELKEQSSCYSTSFPYCSLLIPGHGESNILTLFKDNVL